MEHPQWIEHSICAWGCNIWDTMGDSIVWDTASTGSYESTVFPGGIRYSLVNNVCGVRYSLGYRIHSDMGSPYAAVQNCNFATRSRYVQTYSWEKNYGFTPHLDFNPVPTRFNHKFLPTSMHSQSDHQVVFRGSNLGSPKFLFMNIRKEMYLWQLCS